MRKSPGVAGLGAACVGFGVVQALVGGAGLAARAQTPPPSYTPAQADSGQTLYVQSCALCHGAHLDDGEFGPGLKGAGFNAKWAGRSTAGLFAYVSSLMPPGQAGVLRPDDYADVIAYILQQNGLAPGAAALPSDLKALAATSLPK